MYPRCLTLLLNFLELICKKNNLKNTLTKRRKHGDVHNDSYNNCSRRYEELWSQLTKLKQQKERKLNHRHFENPKTVRKTWMDINNVLDNPRKSDQSIELLSDDDVLVKEKVELLIRSTNILPQLARNWLPGLTMYRILELFMTETRVRFFYLKLLLQRLLKLLNRLMWASGYNQVSVRAMKACKHE
jgi:hypothetical protein